MDADKQVGSKALSASIRWCVLIWIYSVKLPVREVKPLGVHLNREAKRPGRLDKKADQSHRWWRWECNQFLLASMPAFLAQIDQLLCAIKYCSFSCVQKASIASARTK